MGNNPVMMVDPDGEFAFVIPMAAVIKKAILVAKVTKVAVGVAKGAAIAGGLYTAGVATSDGGFNNWSWSAFGNSVGRGALMGGITSGVSVLAQAAGNKAATAKGVSTFMAGSVNMMNHHDAERGFGFHSLGYFAAGAFGASAGIEGGTGVGILMGGSANVIAGYGAGDISSGYGAAQHFVGGGLSAIAGIQHNDFVSEKWGLIPKSSTSTLSKMVNYGAQNVAARFAYTKKEYFLKANLFNHLTGFGAGAGMGYLQSELMKNKMFKKFPMINDLGTANNKLLYSTGLFAMDYAINSNLTYNRQNWRGYFNYKAQSYFFKSLFYSSF